MQRKRELYAVIRIEASVLAFPGSREAVTVTEVVPTLEAAEKEVQRLNALNREKGVAYVWQATRLNVSGGGDRRLLEDAVVPVQVKDLEFAPDFPRQSYEQVAEAVMHRVLIVPDDLRFWAAWTGILYRFAASAEHDLLYKAVSSEVGMPVVDRRRVQDSHLFGFFMAGWSVFECLATALEILADARSGSATEARSESRPARGLTDVARRLRQKWPDERLAARLSAVVAEDAYREFRGTRNLLAHSSYPATTFFVEGSSRGAGVWLGAETNVDERAMDGWRKWLARTLSELLDATAIFVRPR